MQRRTLVYSLILVVLGIAIAVVVVLILRKRAEGPAVVYVPSSPTGATVVTPLGTPTGEATKPRDSYQVAPAWKEGDGPAEAIYRPQPLIVPEP